MGLEDSILGQLPFFILIIFLDSYLIWSKFFNNGQLKVKYNLANISDILIVFIILVITLGGSIIILFSLIGIFNLNFSLVAILTSLPSLMSCIGVAVLIVFLFEYRNKRPKKSHLKEIFDKAIKSYLGVAITITSFYLIASITSLKYVFLDSSAIVLPLIFFIIFVSWALFYKTTFKIDLKKQLKTKKFFFSMLLACLVGLITVSLCLPLAFPSESRVIGYIVYDLNNGDGDYIIHYPSYSIVQTSTKIYSFGIINSISPIIPINYKKEHIEVSSPLASSNFQILINKSNSSRDEMLISTLGEIESYNNQYNSNKEFVLIDNKNYQGIVILKYNFEKIKSKKIKEIKVQGLVPRNLSKSEFLYSDGRSWPCEESKCSIWVNLTSSIDKPLTLEKEGWFNLQSKHLANYSNCRIVNISSQVYSYNLNLTEDYSCVDANTCWYEIRNKTNRHILLRIGAQIEENGNVLRPDWQINQPINVSLIFLIDC